MGTSQYGPIVEDHQVPIVVTGFEPLDLLEGVRQALILLESDEPRLANAYPRAVAPQGNPVARAVLSDVFEVTDRQWRGIGMIPQSGWRLSQRYRDYDAERRFAVGDVRVAESKDCHSGEVLQGLIKPNACPAFGTICTPRAPLGATMVSSEGACAAYYQFRRLEVGTAGKVVSSRG
jgi:hydrogenase expression/formation protein HypD